MSTPERGPQGQLRRKRPRQALAAAILALTALAILSLCALLRQNRRTALAQAKQEGYAEAAEDYRLRLEAAEALAYSASPLPVSHKVSVTAAMMRERYLNSCL